MRILILTQYYPPETGAPQNRLSDLARRLQSFGHDVEVLTALPNYPGDAILPEYIGRANTIEFIDGVRVARVGLFVPRKRTFIKRMACYLSFAANVWRWGPSLVGRADVVVMESPPLFLGLAAVPLARRLGASLVANISDLWPSSAVELGMVKPGPGLWASQRLEAWLYKHSRLITGQTRGIVSDIKTRFPSCDVTLFPNGVDLLSFERTYDRDAIRREFGWNPGTFVVGYAGVLGHAQALDQVLDAASRLASEEHIQFALFGDGPCRDALARRVAVEKLENVSLNARQPSSRIPEILNALDAGVVPLANKPLFEGARPSKMFEIMAAGKPVILCARGEAADVLLLDHDVPAGAICPPEEPAALVEAILRLRSAPEIASAMGRAGRRVVQAHFDRAAIARDFEAAILQTHLPRPAASTPAA